MKNNYFCLNKSYDKEFVYHATFTNNKSISFDNIFVVEKYMWKSLNDLAIKQKIT